MSLPRCPHEDRIRWNGRWLYNACSECHKAAAEYMNDPDPNPIPVSDVRIQWVRLDPAERP